MEILGLVDLPWWVVYPLVLLVTLYSYGKYKQRIFRNLGVPGPSPIAYLGMLRDLAKKGVVQADQAIIEKYGRVAGVYAGNWPQMLIADPEMIKQIMVKDFSNFENRPSIVKADEEMLQTLSLAAGDHWRFLRATISPTFTTGKMKGMSPLIMRCVNTLIGTLEREAMEKSADLQDMFGCYVVDTICSTSFGMEVDSQSNPDDPVVKHIKALMKFSLANPLFLFAIWFPDIAKYLPPLSVKSRKKSRAFFRTLTEEALSERRRSGSDRKDFLQIMVDGQKESDGGFTGTPSTFEEFKQRGITDDEIIANALIFFLVGYHTTGNAMTWLSYVLATHPEVQDRLIREIDNNVGQGEPTYDAVMGLQYLDMVASEALRLYPVASRVNRYCTEDITICGQKIPKGMDVEVPVFTVHRDPEFWPNPEEFDPERFAPENKHLINQYAYLPFGLGPRNCIGMRLAHMQSRMALVAILQKYRFVTTPETQVPVKIGKKGFVAPENGMWLKIQKR